MAQQTINTGTTIGDGTGDTSKAAFDKINANETELYSDVGTLQSDLTTEQGKVTALQGDVGALQSSMPYGIRCAGERINFFVNTLKDLREEGSMTVFLLPTETDTANTMLGKVGGTDQNLLIRGSATGFEYTFANVTGAITLDKEIAHKIAFTWTGTTFKIYIGKTLEVDSTAYTAGAAGIDGEVKWGIGAELVPESFNFVTFGLCTASDFFLFNKELTADEVSKVVDKGAGAIPELGRSGGDETYTLNVSSSSSTGYDLVVTDSSNFNIVSTAANTSDKRLQFREPNDGAAGYESSGLYEFSLNVTVNSGTLSNNFELRASGDVYTIQEGMNRIIVTDFSIARFFTLAGAVLDIDVTDFKIKKIGCEAAYRLNEGIGYQIHDMTWNSVDGFLGLGLGSADIGGRKLDHIAPKDRGFWREKDMDLSAGTDVVIEPSFRQHVAPNCTWLQPTITNTGENATGQPIAVRQSAGGSNPEDLWSTSVNSIAPRESVLCTTLANPQKPSLPNISLKSVAPDANATSIQVTIPFIRGRSEGAQDFV